MIARWPGLAVALVAVGCGDMRPSSSRTLSLDHGGSSSERKTEAETSTPSEAKKADGPRRTVFVQDVGAEQGRVVTCDPNFGSYIGQFWFIIDDNECQGTSHSWLQLLHSGSDGLGCTIRWQGEVTTAYEYGFAAAGVELRDGLDLSKYSGIKMEVRGDGGRYRFQTPYERQLLGAINDPHCQSDEYDFYGTEFTCGDGGEGWSEIVIPFSSLKQEGWGRKYKLDLSQVAQVQIRTTIRPDDAFQCDFKVIAPVK